MTQHNVVRMTSEDVLKLKDTIDTELNKKIDEFGERYKMYKESAIATWKEILTAIDESMKAPTEAPTNDSAEDETFGYSKEFFDLLAAKVRELVLMMRHADGDEYCPLSMGSIKNVGMTLFRRIYFIASEKQIRERTNGEAAYPYIIVDESLLYLMRNIFLKIYFSPICDDLIPFYVFAAIPFCRDMSIYSRNGFRSKLPITFNCIYPINKIHDREINQFNIIDRVNNMKKNNPVGSKPYIYVEPEEKQDTKQAPIPALTLTEKDFPSL